jgi:hypothetical protein
MRRCAMPVNTRSPRSLDYDLIYQDCHFATWANKHPDQVLKMTSSEFLKYQEGAELLKQGFKVLESRTYAPWENVRIPVESLHTRVVVKGDGWWFFSYLVMEEA